MYVRSDGLDRVPISGLKLPPSSLPCHTKSALTFVIQTGAPASRWRHLRYGKPRYPPFRYPRTTMLTAIQARMSSSYSPTPARRGTKSATGFSAHSTDEKQIRHPRLQRDLEQHRCRRCRPFPPCICSMCTTDSFCTQLEAARDSKAPIMYDT